MKIKLILGDCLEQMKKIPDNYVDSIVSDRNCKSKNRIYKK